MAKKKRYARKLTKTRILIIFGGALAVALLSYFLVRNYVAHKKLNAMERQMNEFAEVLHNEGFKETTIERGCAPDPNIKYGGPTLCEVGLSYVHTGASSNELELIFKKLQGIISAQDVYDLSGSLSENLETSSDGAYTYAYIDDDRDDTSCVVSYGYGIGGLKTDALELDISCSFKK